MIKKTYHNYNYLLLLSIFYCFLWLRISLTQLFRPLKRGDSLTINIPILGQITAQLHSIPYACSLPYPSLYVQLPFSLYPIFLFTHLLSLFSFTLYPYHPYSPSFPSPYILPFFFSPLSARKPSYSPPISRTHLLSHASLSPFSARKTPLFHPENAWRRD